MAVHHPHLLDFSNTAMEPPPSFDHHQLLALHAAGTDDMSLGCGGGGVPPHHHRFLAEDDTAASWPLQHQAAVSLSLYNSSPPPLFGHHHQQQQFAAVPPPAAAPNHHQQLPASSMMQPPFQLRSSRYLGPAQELLSEFCSLQGELHATMNKQQRAPKGDVETPSSSSGLWGHPSLSSMDLLELERRKVRLLSMVEEVDRRYRRYREQMRAVEVSFEAVTGAGAAQVYTRLALRAMSRHFRCLRDALVAQVRSLRKAMGERDGGGGASPAGATKGDTPRLKVLDQCLRQQRAFQQPGSIENYPWRPQRGLPERAVAALRAWLFEHFLHPYPNDVDKHILARQTGLSRSQVSNWFINARVRLWKPMIEDMYTEEVKQQSEETTGQNLNPGAVKPEQHNNAVVTASIVLGGESQFRASRTAMTSMSSDHLFISRFPSLQHVGHGGGAVSLTLGLQQQQPSFAPPMMMPHHHHQRSLDEEPVVVMPYTGSQEFNLHLQQGGS